MSEVLSLTSQIKIQRQYMWGMLAMSAFTLSAGIGVSIYFFLGGDKLGAEIPEFLKVGPAFISSAVTAFPLKSLMDCRARLSTYETLQNTMINLSQEEQKTILTQVVTEAFKSTVKI